MASRPICLPQPSPEKFVLSSPGCVAISSNKYLFGFSIPNFLEHLSCAGRPIESDQQIRRCGQVFSRVMWPSFFACSIPYTLLVGPAMVVPSPTHVLAQVSDRAQRVRDGFRRLR